MTKDDWKKIAEATGLFGRFQDSVVPMVLIIIAVILLIAAFPLLGWLFGPGALMLAVLVALGVGLIVYALWNLYDVWTSNYDDDDEDDDDDGGNGTGVAPSFGGFGEHAVIH